MGIGLKSLWYLSKTNCSVLVDRANAFDIDFFANPLMSEDGDFPEILKEQVAAVSLAEGLPTSKLPVLGALWIDAIKGTIDFLGLSYYASRYVDCASECLTLPSNSPFNPDAKLEYTVDPKWPMGIVSRWIARASEVRIFCREIATSRQTRLLSLIYEMFSSLTGTSIRNTVTNLFL